MLKDCSGKEMVRTSSGACLPNCSSDGVLARASHHNGDDYRRIARISRICSSFLRPSPPFSASDRHPPFVITMGLLRVLPQVKILMNGSTGKVLITGATGFIGRNLLSSLVKLGWSLRAAVRDVRFLGVLPPGVEPFLLRGEPDDWLRATEGVKCMVHLIGRAHKPRTPTDLEDFRSVNVSITKAVLESAIQNGVQRFIYMSSIKAVGEGCAIPYNEETPCAPEDPYGRSKLEAEQLILRLAERTTLRPIILRPPLVYGPGVKGNFLRLMRLAQSGYPLPFKSLSTRRSMIFVGNLVDFIATALLHPQAPGGIFHLADAESITIPDLVTRLRKLMGRPARLFPLHPDVLSALATIVGKRKDAERMIRSLTVSITKAQTLLNWDPPYSIDEGLGDTVEWFLHERLANGKERAEL